MTTDPGNAFFAVDLDDDTRHALAAAITDAAPVVPLPGRRVPPENWHVTVRFLGPCEDAVFERAIAAVHEELDVAAGRATVDGLGAFPRPARATVLYASLRDDGTLSTLAWTCEKAARVAGLEPEERPFVPHLTLARLRPQRDVRRLIASFGDLGVRIPISAVTAFRTERSSHGLRYRPVERIPL